MISTRERSTKIYSRKERKNERRKEKYPLQNLQTLIPFPTVLSNHSFQPYKLLVNPSSSSSTHSQLISAERQRELRTAKHYASLQRQIRSQDSSVNEEGDSALCEPGNSPGWWPARRTFRTRTRDQGDEDTRVYPSPLSSPLHSTSEKNSSGREGRLLFHPLVMSDARRSRGRENGVGNGQIGRFRGRAAAMLFPPWSKEKNERERDPLRFSVTARNKGATKL